MRSTKAWDPVQAHYTSAALLKQHETALLVGVTTPMSFGS